MIPNALRLAAILLLIPATCAVAEGPAAPRKPNIIFLFADDLGWGDLGCQGHPYAKTPNLDQLAKEGSRFTQFYVTGVTCCPSRTGFMTGKFPATFANFPAGHGFGSRAAEHHAFHCREDDLAGPHGTGSYRPARRRGREGPLPARMLLRKPGPGQ